MMESEYSSRRGIAVVIIGRRALCLRIDPVGLNLRLTLPLCLPASQRLLHTHAQHTHSTDGTRNIPSIHPSIHLASSLAKKIFCLLTKTPSFVSLCGVKMKCIVRALSIYIIHIECGRMDTLHRGHLRGIDLLDFFFLFFKTASVCLF